MIIKIDHTDSEHPLYAEPMTKLYNLIFGEMIVGSPAENHPMVDDTTLIWGFNSIEISELNNIDYAKIDGKFVFFLDEYEITAISWFENP